MSLNRVVSGLWERGEWRRLLEVAGRCQDDESDVEIIGYVIAAHLQLGDVAEARRILREVLTTFPGSRPFLLRIVLSCVHNSLGRASLAAESTLCAREHFSRSLFLVRPRFGNDALPAVRGAIQATDLGIAERELSYDWSCLLKASEGAIGGSDSGLLPDLFRKLRVLIARIATEGGDLSIGGTSVVNGDDPFLPGKALLGAAHLVADDAVSAPDAIERCRQFRELDQLFSSSSTRSWGALFYLMAIAKVREAGRLDYCLSYERIIRLRDELDWRDIVDDRSYTLRGLPNNYYQVAFGIAQIRFQLGWENAGPSFDILDAMLDQYDNAASECGFMDETDGDGRYDRYSILLVAEIAHRFRQGGLLLPKRLRERLRRSAEVAFTHMNQRGVGFQYGRSIGPYGDSALLEILSAAAWHGLLSRDEAEASFAFSCIATQRFLSYWWDDKLGCVNLWEHGRAADPYRHKGRILGETLSLLHQHIYTHRVWSRLGFRADHGNQHVLRRWLDGRPASSLTWFRRGKAGGERALLTYRDGGRVFSLPLVNGGKYVASSAYLPIPYSTGLIEGSPGKNIPQLVPRVVLGDGAELMPIGSFSDICTDRSDGLCIRWSVSELRRVDKTASASWYEAGAQVFLRSSPGHINCIMKLLPRGNSWSGELRMRFVSLAQPLGPLSSNRRGSQQFDFASDSLLRMSFRGFEEVSWDPTDRPGTPGGGAAGTFLATRKLRNSNKPVIIGWRMHYQGL